MLALVRRAFQGQYEVEREIGKGGNARIYLARGGDGREVALKILHPELLVSVAADRFLREIKLARQLDHPHIAHLLDSGEREWLVYYVMTYVEGPTLREHLARVSRMSVPETIRLGRRSARRAGPRPWAQHRSPGCEAGQRRAGHPRRGTPRFRDRPGGGGERQRPT